MAVNTTKRNRASGLNNPLQDLAPMPIVAVVDPTTADKADLGTLWVNTATATIWACASLAGGVTTWTTSPASGVGVFTSVTINPGNLTVTAGDVLVSAGDLTLTAGDLSVGGDTLLSGALTVTGVSTFNGDVVFNAGVDINTAGTFQVTSTDDVADAILLETNGGTSETLVLSSVQGTSAAAIDIASTSGGVSVTSGGAGVNINVSVNDNTHINTGTSTGAVSIGNNAAGTITVISNTASGAAITLTAHNAAGGITATSGSAGINLNVNTNQPTNINTGTSTGAVNIGSATAGVITIESNGATGSDIVVNAHNAAGGVVITSGSGAVNINKNVNQTTNINTGTSTGAVNIGSAVAGEIVIASNGSSGSDIVLNAANAAGGIEFTAGTGGILAQSGGTQLTLSNGTQSARLLVGTGSPNGTVTALQGSLFINVAGSTSKTILYCNTDGGTTWVGVGS